MTRKHYTDEELISELIRFERENGRTPKAKDMVVINGYPPHSAYQRHFGNHNNALSKTSLKFNQHRHKLNGTEICSYCGKRADEIDGFRKWRYNKNHIRFCERHGGGSDYITGNLNINSGPGRGRSGEKLVANVLNIGKEHDYNRNSCRSPVDLYNKKYGRIDVKTSLLNYKYNKWGFNFGYKKEADTYICIGLSVGSKLVEHVWIILNENKFKNKSGISITNTYLSLSNWSKYETDVKIWNKIWISMNLDDCSELTNKDKRGLNKNKNIKKEEIKTLIIFEDNKQFKLDKWM